MVTTSLAVKLGWKVFSSIIVWRCDYTFSETLQLFRAHLFFSACLMVEHHIGTHTHIHTHTHTCTYFCKVKLGGTTMFSIFLMMVSVILGSFYHADICSTVHFSDKFGFN